VRENNLPLFRKSYRYDAYGNPIEETFSGNLTGEGVEESSTIMRTFSQDGRNLLLREEHPNGKILSFCYLENTNLLTAKLTLDRPQILQREFWEYDENHNLIKKIVDDGLTPEKENLTGVNYRRFTKYRLKQDLPFLHLPKTIDEGYLEAGKEKLLTRTHLTYDTYGNVSQEDVHDAEGICAYTIKKSYSESGNLLSESNALGQIASYEYDARGHQIRSKIFLGVC
jgi:YD repeat-containing protein